MTDRLALMNVQHIYSEKDETDGCAFSTPLLKTRLHDEQTKNIQLSTVIRASGLFFTLE